MKSHKSLLNVRNVHVQYSARGQRSKIARAVDGVDLEIESGEIVALVGESGCGKTSLARAILGLQNISEGSIGFDGEEISTATTDKRSKSFHRRVQIVFQDPTASINPRHSVYEIVAEGLRIHGLSGDEKNLVEDALEKCGLHPAERYMLKYPHELSGGQRQRVVIAGAMVLKPQLLVADEPVSSLDASVRGEILKLLQTLAHNEGMAVLVVTHDLGLPWNIADRIAVMYLGRIVELGTTEELLENPRHPYTQALLSVLPQYRDRPQQILVGEMPDPTRIASGCRFHPRCPVVQSRQSDGDESVSRCLSENPELKILDGQQMVACHLAGS